MRRLQFLVDQRQAKGLSSFAREEAQQAIDVGPAATAAPAQRLIRQGKLSHRHHDFYVILRPEAYRNLIS
jgi:hypothetical protein